LDMKQDEEALRFLQEADKTAEPDGRIEFNLGVAFYRRKEPEKARAAWKRAAARKIQEATDRLEEMKNKQSGAWMDCWFGTERSCGRKIAGVLLVLLLVSTCAMPLLKEDALPGLNTGQEWTV